MKKALVLLALVATLALPTLAIAGGLGGWGGHQGDGGTHPGGGGVPEPLTMILIAAGGGLALGARKLIKKK